MSTKKKITIEIPAPTPWPFLAAFGLSLGFAGLLTMWLISVVGLFVLALSAVGWIRQCYPEPKEVTLKVEKHHIPSEVSTLQQSPDQSNPYHRARLPLEIHRVKAGVIAGIAGGLVMGVLGMIGGLVSHGSIWYPVNVVAATLVDSIPHDQLAAFHGVALVTTIIIHSVLSIGLGLLYGILLPLMPKRPILLGSLVLPFIWSFFIFALMQFLNPLINDSINWFWFLITQVAFGVVAGIVVDKSERIPTLQFKAFAQRAGIEEDTPT